MNRFQHVLSALGDGDYQVTLHARQRMASRCVTHQDIRACGSSGTAKAHADGKIQVRGFDCDCDELTLICVEESGILIITVF